MKRWMQVAAGALLVGIAAVAAAETPKASPPKPAVDARGEGDGKAPIRFPLGLTPKSTVADLKRMKWDCDKGVPPVVGPSCELRQRDKQIAYEEFRSKSVHAAFANDVELRPHLQSVEFRMETSSCQDAKRAFQAAIRLLKERYAEGLKEERTKGLTEEGDCTLRSGTRLRLSDDEWAVEATLMPVLQTFFVSIDVMYRPHLMKAVITNENFKMQLKKKALEKL